MQVKIHEAKTNLSKLIQAALDGQEVIIARGDQPVVRLVAIRRGFKLGLLEGRLGQTPDFLTPMT